MQCERHVGLWAFVLCIPSPLCTGYCSSAGFSLLLGLCSILPCACGLAGAPIMMSLILLFCWYLWAYELKLPPINFLYSFFFWALLHNILARLVHSAPWASLAHFVLWASSAHFILRASLTHSILSYLFHSHELFLNPLGFPSIITTSFSFGFIDLQINPIY